MATNKRPSFLKRQKEQARIARANEKRESRRARKQARKDGILDEGPAPEDMVTDFDGEAGDEAGDETGAEAGAQAGGEGEAEVVQRED